MSSRRIRSILERKPLSELRDIAGKAGIPHSGIKKADLIVNLLRADRRTVRTAAGLRWIDVYWTAAWCSIVALPIGVLSIVVSLWLAGVLGGRPDSESPAGEARAALNVATESGDRGEWIEAFEQIRSARDQFRRLKAEGDREIQEELAVAEKLFDRVIDELKGQGRRDYRHARELEKNKQLEDALRMLERAVTAFALLVAAGETSFEDELARALSLQAAVLVDLDRPDDGLAKADDALVIYERVITEGRTERESDRAVCWANRGNALYDLERRPEAHTMFAKASQFFRLREDWGMLIWTLKRSGDCYSVENDHRAAEPYYLETIKEFNEPGRQLPGKNVQATLGECHENLALGYLTRGDLAEADSHLESALTVYRKLAGERIGREDEQLRRLSATVKEKLPKGEDASTELEQMEELLKAIHNKL